MSSAGSTSSAESSTSPGAYVGARVRDMRTRQGISLRELARRLDLSPATITALETGRTTMSIDRLHAIATVLDIAPGDLFAGAPAGPGSPNSTSVGDRPPNWREYGDLEMDVVLRAAVACIVRKGYEGSSIRDIAEEANSSVSALYHYYPSKQAMLVAIFELTMTDLLRRVTAARDEEEGDSPISRLARLVESLTLYHSYRKELGFIGSSEMRSLEDSSYSRIAAKRVEVQRMVDAEVYAGVEQGLFGTTRPREAARAVVAMCVAVAQWFDTARNERPEDVAAAYIEFALDLVKHRPDVPESIDRRTRT
ncbi:MULTISPECIES: TetR family transcriptional regulator [Nocardiaceae]|uniref:TetR family transcriptional regulator n=1 Tax=Nocardiaceae TaxID=85025 RepID=UPI000690C7D4|nr:MULTISPECIES: TetR family transcriptional regulator [Rhodococcus]OZF00896.1 TetR family transcriptional regulator [Rhodococcus sp. 15-1189-1-1a]OZF14549.1 TetR family transcriptional regulator [Rhodococcus sp. 14-2686-1-2]OZF53034.1 TetR family transcriptional regulator [Rhodococcus sp. 14-2470-1b]